MRDAQRQRAHMPLQALAHRFPDFYQRCPAAGIPHALWNEHDCTVLLQYHSGDAYLDRLLHDFVRLRGERPPVAEDLLTDLRTDVLQAPLWASPRQSSSLAAQMLGKALPQRCQRRQYPELVAETLKDPEARRIFMEMVVCSLLGNYRHITRPLEDVERRRRLYAWLREDMQHILEAILLRHPRLVAFATREYLVYALRDIPALRRHCGALFDVDKFDRVVVNCMDTVRNVVATHTLSEWDGLFTALFVAEHERFLTTCYHRQRPPFVHEIQSARVDPNTKLPEVSETISRAIGTIVQRLPVTTSDLDASDLLVEALPLLGGSEAARLHFRALRHSYDVMRAGKRQFRQAIANAARTYPFSMAVLRLASKFWRLHSGTQLVTLPLHVEEAQVRGLSALTGNTGLVPRERAVLYLCHVCCTVYSIVRRPVTTVKNTYLYGMRNARVDLRSPDLEPYCSNKKRMGHMVCGERPLVQVPLLGRMLYFNREALFICAHPKCGAMAKLCPDRCCYTPDGYYCIECSKRRRALVLLQAIERTLGFPVPRQKTGEVTLECSLCIGRNTRVDQNALAVFYSSLLAYGHAIPALASRLAQTYDLRPVHSVAQLFLYRGGVLLCRRHHRKELYQVVQALTNVFSTRSDVVTVILEWKNAQRLIMDTMYQRRNRAALSALRQQNRSRASHNNRG